MRSRSRLHAAILALGVAASSLTLAAVPAMSAHAASASCGSKMLGPAVNITDPWGNHVGSFYMGWNQCGAAYAEAYLPGSVYGSGQMLIKTGSGSAYKDTGGPSGQHYWDIGWLSIYSPPSSDRNYVGTMNFDTGSYSCAGQTYTWNFSGSGAQYTNPDDGSPAGVTCWVD
ncbi:hypothetical protein ABIA33_005087 [Streptacidiphilus sp. MAP12-16]|uniref:hypothetical protein n=1 Tax=Streptacidiphilus sp. MAP12-16 TaxID=3156300 RepID=UPI0035196688